MKLQIGKKSEPEVKEVPAEEIAKEVKPVDVKPKGIQLGKRPPTVVIDDPAPVEKPITDDTPVSEIAARYEQTKARQSKLNSLLAKDKKPEIVAEKSPETKPAGIQLGSKQVSNPPVEIANEDIPTLAPVGEKYVLNAEATEQLPAETLEGFAKHMQTLIDTMGTKELSNSLHAILKYTKEHPELKGILRPEDVQLFVRGCRQSYGLVVKAKQTNQAKRKVSSANVEDVMNDLADIQF